MLNQFNVSLWGDESFSAILSMKPVPEIIRIIIRDTSPPLYNLSEHFWFRLFGSSEISIRSLSFLYFSIAVFFVFLIGSRLWNKRTGLLAALLTFLNPFFFIYAFEGRMYSILAATVCASMYFFLTQNWILYVITSALALYSHHFAIFALFVQGLWFLYEFFFGKRKIAFSMFKSFLAILVLYLPWVYPLYLQTKMVGGGFWLGTPTLTDLSNLISEYLAEGIKHSLARPALILSLVVLALRRWPSKIKESAFALSWFLVPILLCFLISQHFQSIFFNRYLLYAIPGAMLLLASNRRSFSITVLILLIGFFGIIDYRYFTHPAKQPFRDLATYVKESVKGDDFLINWNSASHHLWETQYYGIPAPLYIPEDKELPFFVGTALMTDQDIISEIPSRLPDKSKVNRVGAITSGPIEEIEIPGYTEKEVKTFKDLKVVWLEKTWIR